MSKITPPEEQFFAKDYFQARSYFLEAAEKQNAHLTHFLCPFAGPDGREIYTDLAFIGPRDAAKLIILVSATHGIEGFCGSALQCQFLQQIDKANLDENTAIMIIHAINPYGFAWKRRTNEHNVDLNRNFISFLNPLPNNPVYETIYKTLCPENWPGQFRRINDLKLLYFLRKYGTETMQEAITQGQFDFPKGIFYGGIGPSWSRQTFESILKGWTYKDQKILFIDIHTGLGEFGEEEIISSYHPSQKEYQKCKSFFKDENLKFSEDGNSVSASLCGVIEEGLHYTLPENDINAVTLEFGTYDKEKVLEALRAENWLIAHGDSFSEEGHYIKKDFEEMFYPNSQEWRNLISQNGMNFLWRSLKKFNK